MKKNKKSSFAERKSLYAIVIIIVIAIVLLGFVYFSSVGKWICGPCGCFGDQCGGGGYKPPSCVCAWNNTYACGKSPTDGNCILFIWWNGWWKKCQCSPSGCGLSQGITCSGSSENTEICRNTVNDPVCR